LIAQIKEREAALLATKQKKAEMDKREREGYKELMERHKRNKLTQRQYKIKEDKIEMAKMLENQRLKKVLGYIRNRKWKE